LFFHGAFEHGCFFTPERGISWTGTGRNNHEKRTGYEGPKMKLPLEDGFTLMETLVTIGITLILGGILVSVFSLGLRGAEKALTNTRTASEIARTDGIIRERVENFHVPYWANPAPHIEGLTQSMMRSKTGERITAISPIYDGKKRVRGLAVNYRIGGKDTQTRALFPGSPVLEK
jgi:hypothetical protein